MPSRLSQEFSSRSLSSSDEGTAEPSSSEERDGAGFKDARDLPEDTLRLFVMGESRRSVVVVSELKAKTWYPQRPRYGACPLETMHIPTARRGQDPRTLRR